MSILTDSVDSFYLLARNSAVANICQDEELIGPGSLLSAPSLRDDTRWRIQLCCSFLTEGKLRVSSLLR